MFVEKSDFNSSIYPEILNAYTRSNTNIDEALEAAVNSAITEASAYMSATYDVADIFGKTGSNRNPFIVMIIKDIAIYHIYSMITKSDVSPIREKRYNDAIEMLKNIQKGILSFPGMISVSNANPEKGQVQFGSNIKRNNHY